MRKFRCLLFVLKRSYICYYIICLTVSLMFKKFLSLPNDSIKVCVKGKMIIPGVGYGLEIPPEYIFYSNEKSIQWAKRTLDGVDGNTKKKSFKMFKIK